MLKMIPYPVHILFAVIITLFFLKVCQIPRSVTKEAIEKNFNFFDKTERLILCTVLIVVLSSCSLVVTGKIENIDNEWLKDLLVSAGGFALLTEYILQFVAKRLFPEESKTALILAYIFLIVMCIFRNYRVFYMVYGMELIKVVFPCEEPFKDLKMRILNAVINVIKMKTSIIFIFYVFGITTYFQPNNVSSIFIYIVCLCTVFVYVIDLKKIIAKMAVK